MLSKFLYHSDLKRETRAMLPNISGFKEGKAKILAGLRNFHEDGWVKHRKPLVFTSNTKS